MPSSVGLYPNIIDTTNRTDLPIDIFLGQIGSGKWQDIIIDLRVKLKHISETILDPKARDKAKQAAKRAVLPYVTISGLFGTRNNEGLIEHSGYLAIDIDDMNPNDAKKLLRHDRHVYTMFTSCSGNGLCVIFKIHPLKHLASFEGVAEYLYQHYKIVVDQACKDLSRPRYVSFDPAIFINDHASEFKQFAKEKSGPKSNKKERAVVFIPSEFRNIIAEIEEKGVDLVSNYHQWLKVAYAFADQFGEDGRDYFHQVSRQGSTYTPDSCDRQYSAVLKNLKEKDKPATIASFYYQCKQAGIMIASDTVTNISIRAATHKKAKSTEIQSVQNIIQYPEVDNQDPDLVAEIVKQVYEKDIYIEDVSDIEICRIWVRNNGLRRNEITGQLHLDKNALTNPELNSIELRMREDMPEIERSSIKMTLDSDAVESFHEVKDFFKKYKYVKGTGAIAALASTINSPTGEGTDYVDRMLRKWLVGGIACIYGNESHTMLVLCGEKHGTGKSFFFKNLLPPELAHLCAGKDFSVLGNSADKKDFEISITRSWLIFDDEMGNKTKRDHRLIKAMLAKSYTDVRAAYARTEEHRKRIAFFGGTSNDLDILSDHGENRRIIPIQILKGGIDKKKKDAIDPIEYIMEAYHLYQSDYDYKILDEEIDFLNEHTEQFKESTFESELVGKHFKKPEAGCGEYVTGTDIKIALESSIKDKVRIDRIKPAMKEIGIPQEVRRINGVLSRCYYVCRAGLDFYLPGKTFTEDPF